MKQTTLSYTHSSLHFWRLTEKKMDTWVSEETSALNCSMESNLSLLWAGIRLELFSVTGMNIPAYDPTLITHQIVR